MQLSVLLPGLFVIIKGQPKRVFILAKNNLNFLQWITVFYLQNTFN